MYLTFTVNGSDRLVEIPETDDLASALQFVQAEVATACGSEAVDPKVAADLYVAALNALVEQVDIDIGEVLAEPELPFDYDRDP